MNFFISLRDAKIPVSLREYLTLLEAMDKGVADYKVDNFYYLARSCLVKDERNLDKFDQVFGKCFEGLELTSEDEEVVAEIPEDWLRSLSERVMTSKEMAYIVTLL